MKNIKTGLNFEIEAADRGTWVHTGVSPPSVETHSSAKSWFTDNS
jgi:hypothetical protein